jgi:hypothetical protein
MAMERASAGDSIPAACRLIEVHVAELKQLFNAMDPSPFRQRHLDPQAEEFIAAWARELPGDASLALVVHLDRPAGLPDEPALLRDATREFFNYRYEMTRRKLRQLFRVGRITLVIGLGFLAASVLGGDILTRTIEQPLGGIVRESLLIGGWVAMWRPLDTFLYDWWPIRSEARLFKRLSAMPVRITYGGKATSDAWRRDWPAASPSVSEAPRP